VDGLLNLVHAECNHLWRISKEFNVE
jgi:hypothetical protein